MPRELKDELIDCKEVEKINFLNSYINFSEAKKDEFINIVKEEIFDLDSLLRDRDDCCSNQEVDIDIVKEEILDLDSLPLNNDSLLKKKFEVPCLETHKKENNREILYSKFADDLPLEYIEEKRKGSFIDVKFRYFEIFLPRIHLNRCNLIPQADLSEDGIYICSKMQLKSMSTHSKKASLDNKISKLQRLSSKNFFNDKKSLNSVMLSNFDKKQSLCNWCQKTFNGSSKLKRHMLVHSREKPFSCETCNKCFTDNSSLKKHKVLHSGKKPFQCNWCESSFSQNGHLKEHMIIHTREKPYICNICKACFTKKSSLKPHMLIHTGKKLFTCDLCGASFTHRRSVKRHKMTHSGMKPFTCDVCKKSFTRKHTVRSHLLKHSIKK